MSRFHPPTLLMGCPTPPLSPPIEREDTPSPKNRSLHLKADATCLGEGTELRTPRASQIPSPAWPAQPRHAGYAPKPINAVDPALAAPRNKGLTVIYTSRPRPAPKGKRAHAALLVAIKSARREVVETTIKQLGEAHTVFGVRYDNFAALRSAASTPSRFDCLKAMLRALPDEDVRGLMRTHSRVLCDAAERADATDYANWLIFAFGHDALQYISER